MPDPDASLNDAATFAAVRSRPVRDDESLGDEGTLGDGRSGQDTVIDDIEVVDLEARYRVEGALGQGGMGAVLLATDPRLGRKVAIKRILGESARSKAAIGRFMTEARAIAAISHPNVVQIYELGVAKDGPFLVIEYIDGGSLLERCKAGAIPLEEAVKIVCQVCDGLTRAHDAGIVHRDIKPANILLTKDGLPKLTDFGLAKAEAADHQMTMTGAVLGTPDFMPPEQRKDAALVDHRSDLWSLAATLYQMVSGRSPKVIRLHELPPALQPIIAKALEDEKDARYQSAKEFRDVLERLGAAGRKPAAPAQSDGVLAEGQCKACGTATTDLTRKFCPNPQCGAGLRMACLKCAMQIPVWDPICGECGGRQTALLAAKRESLSAVQEEARALLAGFAFDEAIAHARPLVDETHPDLAEFGRWAGEFVASAMAERDRQRALGEERLHAARAHVKAWDYPAAIQAIESIPAPLRDAVTNRLLEQCGEHRRESDELITTIASRIGRKEIDGLLPIVERAVELRGDRKDLHKIHGQLTSRRDERVSRARVAMDAGDVVTAARALADLSVDDLGNDASFRDHVDRAMAAERRLLAFVKKARGDGVVSLEEAERIAQLGEECLALNPRNAKAQQFVQQSRNIIEKHRQHEQKERARQREQKERARQREQEYAERQQRKKQEEVIRSVVRHAIAGTFNPEQILALPPIRNSIGVELKLLPAGSFKMPFLIGVYEVTNAQWRRVMGSVPSHWKDDDRPVEQVRWRDAMEFCRELSALTEEKEAGRLYRLPTEAEWEYACRAGTTTRYSFGDQTSQLHAHGWFDGNAGNHTHPVGLKMPNPWGLYDMHGNVWEWCSDSCLDYGKGAVKPPQGRRSGPDYVLRGGSWYSNALSCESAYRLKDVPSYRYNLLGFRLALSPSVASVQEASK